MSRPIKLTEALRKAAIEEFSKIVCDMKMADGKISYNRSFTYKDDAKATVVFTPISYTKMIHLITSFNTEVAWHGVGRRVSGSTFLITDILIYPQTVTGGNVNMDPVSYAEWICKNAEDERFDNIIMQGHSHVNFSTTPSQVDKMHQEEILNMLGDDNGFYIFVIWNKKNDNYMCIYDYENNTMYEDGDIEYKVVDDSLDLDAFVKEAREFVKVKSTAATTALTGTSYGGSYVYDFNKDKGDDKNTKGKSKKNDKKDTDGYGAGNGWKGKGYDYMDDDATGYYYGRY